MREIVRLIAFAIVTFGITALALLLSNPEFTRDLSRRVGLVDPREEGATERLEEGDRIIGVSRPHLGRWVGLQGFPSEASLRFPLPASDGILRAQLHLNLATHLIAQGDGLVRAFINGRERDALVLEPGQTSAQLTYELLPADLAGGEVVLRLSGNGTTNGGQICPSNVTDLGVTVEILPTSAVVIEYDRPLAGIAEHVVLTPDPLGLDMATEPVLAAWASQYLTRQGVETGFAPAQSADTVLLQGDGTAPLALSGLSRLTAFGRPGIDAIGALRGMARPASYGQQWPLPITALTDDMLVHTFRGSTRWVLDYKLADLPGGRAPAAMSLALRTSQLQGANQWTLRVLLNGRMIHNSTHDGSAQDWTVEVPIPAREQGLANQLVVVLVDSSAADGICRVVAEAAAQLMPTSRLEASASTENDKQVLVARLASAQELAIGGSPDLGTGDVVRASALFDMLLPLDRTVSFSTSGEVSITVLDQKTMAASKASQQAGYLVVPSRSAGQDGIVVLPLAEGAVQLPGDALTGVLVSW